MRHHARGAASIGVVLALCVAACDGNGELFNDVLAGSASGEPAPSLAEPEPEPARPEPAAVEPPSAGQPGPGEMPVAGEIPRVDPEPSEPSAPEPAPSPEPSGPVIVSVSPENGARGVENDTPIVLRFSEPMDRASTEAAYQSELVPSRSVVFAWSEDSTELAITPLEPLEYGVGSSAVEAEARRVSFFISASASSADAEPLDRPYEFSFSLLRRVAFVVPAIADRGKSGNYRSNDSYGTGVCAEDELNMCVGDVRVGRQSEQYKGFISFELGGALPPEARELTAELSIELTDTSGNPFAGLGDLLVEHVRFDEIGFDAFEAEPLDALGSMAAADDEGSALRAEVSAGVLADLEAASALSQYRLAFEEATDADVASDAIISALDTQRLEVSFLVP
jgi:Big-like domain-containing protein